LTAKEHAGQVVLAPTVQLATCCVGTTAGL